MARARRLQGVKKTAASPIIVGSTFSWSGYTWNVRPSSTNLNPGPNDWSDQNVALGADGALYMSIIQRAGSWTCSEIAGPTLGYGKYQFVVDSEPLDWDSVPVLGLFTYDDYSPAENYREIDIELSKWTNPSEEATELYSIQPGGVPAHIADSTTNHQGPYTTEFIWLPGLVYFSTRDRNGMLLGEQVVTEGIFTPGTETVRINLWLAQGLAPLNSQPLTVKIPSFSFAANQTYTLPVASAKVIDFADDSRGGFMLRGGASIISSQLTLPCTPGYSIAYTGAIADLQGSSVDTHIVSVPGVGNHSREASWILRYDNNNYITMIYADGVLLCRVIQGGVMNSTNVGAYNAVAHRYWRIRESAGTIYFEASPDRSAWTLLTPKPHSLSGKLLMRIRYECGYWDAETNPSPLIVGGINTI